ncbi:MAG: ComEC/Rec2 family competence protein [Oscillospiraceae bacterium]|nr:ComEC/Rec2 family competence protein [Oscillospiraceae bacterium]
MRKLATAAAAFSAAVFASHYLVPRGVYLICAAACALLSLSSLLLKGDARTRVLLVSLSVAFGFLVSQASYQYKILPAARISGTEKTVTARVTDYPEIHDSYVTATVRLTGEDTPRLAALLYAYGDEISDLSPGDIVEATVGFKQADIRYGEEFSGYNADNVYLLCYLKDGVEVTGKSAFSFLYFPKTLAKIVKDISLKVFPDSTAPLMTALLTGDTNLLYEDTVLYANMAESGILHIVAVSGMNVAFLVGFIQLIVRRKKLASLIAIPLVWIFVPFAGATPSVVRAAFMITTVLIAPLINRENDGLTSLAAILALMLLLNPAACASISLQLSFSAMLGMIFVTPRIYKPMLEKIKSIKWKTDTAVSKAISKLLTGACAAFAATLGALVFTTPVAEFYFGYVSLIGILVNVLIFWVISGAFILGYISCCLGLLWLPAGALLGALTSLLARYIIALVGAAASVPYAAVYTRNNLFGWWLALVYIIFFICYVFRRSKGFRPVIPVCLAAISLCCVILVSRFAIIGGDGCITVVDVGQGQSLIFTSGDTTAVIDCGGKGKNMNAGDNVAGLLLGSGRSTVDVLLLTHFDDDHVNGVMRLMSRMNVERLVIPEGSYDKPQRGRILELAESLGTSVYIIEQDATVTEDGLEIRIYPTFSQNEPSLIFLASIGNFDALVSGDAGISEEEEFIAAHELPDAELFIAGHHGSKYSSSAELLGALNAEYAAVSCGYNSYGHPTKEALSRFDAAGMRIYRTDENGNITFDIDG